MLSSEKATPAFALGSAPPRVDPLLSRNFSRTDVNISSLLEAVRAETRTSSNPSMRLTISCVLLFSMCAANPQLEMVEVSCS